MGGGRDFAGNMIYRRVGGKYERVSPYRKDLENLIDRMRRDYLTKTELKELMQQFGLKEEQLGYIDQVPAIKDRQEMSVGLARMAMTYGTDMFGELSVDDTVLVPNALAYVNSGEKDIHLNPTYFSSKATDVNDYRSGVETGFHPKGDGNEMTVMHEYAHLLQRRLSGITKNKEKQLTQDIERIREIDQQIDEIDDVLGPTWWKYLSNVRKTNEMYGKEGVTLDDIYKAEKENQKLYLEAYNSEHGINRGYINHRKELYDERNKLRTNIRLWDVSEKSQQMISTIFSKIGAPKPSDVATKLTGRADAYASKNWSEAHAECVADYMVNGKNASAISIAYVREMNKVFKNTK